MIYIYSILYNIHCVLYYTLILVTLLYNICEVLIMSILDFNPRRLLPNLTRHGIRVKRYMIQNNSSSVLHNSVLYEIPKWGPKVKYYCMTKKIIQALTPISYKNPFLFLNPSLRQLNVLYLDSSD